eukprot:CAMPEP_0173425808 /NCGR_PEP_ID=MMETSP1357-20121228/5430_1 /TAXON_ID=77926 /ORGANISM="Hemiselmis rufescens, Strain PCC563" /LENGTH=38 /DNA_ID= /DNA_START= /DNA_END= /DNA_ORIENTATION=
MQPLRHPMAPLPSPRCQVDLSAPPAAPRLSADLGAPEP